MARKGSRVVDGRVLDLAIRYVGVEAKQEASGHAARLRKAGAFVRVIKYGTVDYGVFSLGPEQPLVSWVPPEENRRIACQECMGSGCDSCTDLDSILEAGGQLVELEGRSPLT